MIDGPIDFIHSCCSVWFTYHRMRYNAALNVQVHLRIKADNKLPSLQNALHAAFVFSLDVSPITQLELLCHPEQETS